MSQTSLDAAASCFSACFQRCRLLPFRLLPMLPPPVRPQCVAGLPGMEQARALAPAPRGMRKVVVATNIAETSLTLEGVVYVVDSCFAKQRCYNPLLGLEALLVAPTSKVWAASVEPWSASMGLHACPVFQSPAGY
eukprot:22742-Chlamydomonas_euryale.AAC.1